ncbi:hypothetical protein [Microbacter margulisiae]|uniref:Uncharacterized protein n=1 Tax=Microbacter margulisiae TaxID=1350067 RepID=A0A7W5DNE3_9PORP|nr:hypothetical protein [Microbacter margulisiae]MBB3186022.1 hypothetical protein [Microbacter margulisiae]
MKFSAIYQPTNLFSLKESNSTNSGAKSLLLPSPYSIKMALFNQAITIDGTEQFENKKSQELSYIRDAGIEYFISGSFCVNNCFVTIQSLRDGTYRGKPSFREYIYLSDNIEIIFEVKDESAKAYLQKYLHRINYFGKRGCFFQFVGYNDSPSKSNVNIFDVKNFKPGILQEYDDMAEDAEFKHINNFDSATAKRSKKILLIPVHNENSSKSYTHYKII